MFNKKPRVRCVIIANIKPYFRRVVRTRPVENKRQTKIHVKREPRTGGIRPNVISLGGVRMETIKEVNDDRKHDVRQYYCVYDKMRRNKFEKF